MRIGFDAKRLFLNNTGLGNYSRTLVRNLIKFYPDHHYFLYTPRSDRNTVTEFFFDKNNITIVTPNGKGGPFWRSKGIMKQLLNDKLDIYHGLSNELPFGIDQLDLKSLVTIHDVIFKRYPKQYPFLDRVGYNLKTKKAIQQADHIIAISKQTESDLIEFFNAPSSKMSLLYQTCNPFFTDDPIIPREIESDYFLYVGSVIERKNLLSILKAMTKMTNKQKLVVVGKGGSYYNQCKSYASANGLDAYLTWKGIMDNEEIKELYKNAIALVYPSIFEGFGIPVIESLYCGRPVITSNLSSLKEAGGNAALLVDPFNVEELKNAMEIMTKVEERRKFHQKIAKHLESFDAKLLSAKLMQIYQS